MRQQKADVNIGINRLTEMTSKNKYINTSLLLVDDHILLQKTEDALHFIIFQRKVSIRLKIFLNSEPIEQLLHFTFLSCDIS